MLPVSDEQPAPPFRKPRKREPITTDLSPTEVDALERVRAALEVKLGGRVLRSTAMRIVTGAGLELLLSKLEAPPCDD